MTENNPAGQLKYWLERARDEFDHEVVVLDAFGSMWEIDTSDVAGRTEFLRRSGLLVGLLTEVRARASALPSQEAVDVLMTDFNLIERSMITFLDSRRTKLLSMFDPMDKGGWTCLRMLDGLFEANGLTTPYNRSRASELCDQVRDLIDSIAADTALSSDIRIYVINLLRDVERALLDSEIAGPEGVVAVTNALRGSVSRDGDNWDRIKETKWAPRIVSVYVGLCMTISAVADGAALMPGIDPEPIVIEHHAPESPDDVAPHVEPVDVGNA